MKLHFSICYWQGDWRSVPRLQQEITSLFPDASVSFVPDGLTPLAVPNANSFERLKPIDGGAWLRRILETCPTECDLFIKVEPDVTLRRAPTSRGKFPDVDWFGHLCWPMGAARALLRGGFWGIKPKAVQRLIDSQVLESKDYLSDSYKYDRYGFFLLPGEAPGPMIYNCDTIMASAMSRIGILPTHWPEIYLSFREPMPRNAEQYAVSTIQQ